MQMQDNQRFAQTINTNITKMFYDYMIYKVRMRENLNIAIKGEFNGTISYCTVKHQTRSGKSTVGLSIGNFIASMTKVPYTDFHICANESEYYSKVRNAKFNELYHNQAIQEDWNADGNRRAERVQSQLAGGQIRRRVVQKLKAEQRRDGDYGQNYWVARIPRNSEMQNRHISLIALNHYSQAMFDKRHACLCSGQIFIPLHPEAPVRTCSHRLIQCDVG